MKILIVSDTHNNIDLFKQVLLLSQVDQMYHLGDYYEDSVKADYSQYCSTLYRVPGIFHAGYGNGSIAPIENLDLFGFTIKLVHNIADLDFAEETDNIVFYGHTHVHKVQKYESNILINPGHLKALEDRNQAASYLLMTASKSLLKIDYFQVDKGLIKSYKIIKNKDNKLEIEK